MICVVFENLDTLCSVFASLFHVTPICQFLNPTVILGTQIEQINKTMTVVSSVYFKPYVEYRTFLVWSVTYTAKCSRQKSTSCTVLIVECKMKCAM